MPNFDDMQQDLFFEQLVKIKPKPATVIVKILMYVVALMLVFFMVSFALKNPFFLSFVVVLTFLVVLGLSKALKLLNIEYEYIITNGEMDVDRIIGKEKRKRMITFDLRRVEEAGVYNSEAAKRLGTQSFADKLMACDSREVNRLYLVTRQKKGLCLVVIAPNEKMAGALERVIPPSVLRR